MDEEQKTLNENGEQNTPSVPSTEEQKTPEVKEEPVSTEKTAKSTDKSKTEGDKKVSGAEKRIHDLVEERNQFKAKAQDLSQKLAELTGEAEVSAGYSPTYQPSEGASQGGERELTIDDLRAIARLEVEKEKTINRINTEAKEALVDHPELNPESDKFDPDINDAVTEAVHAAIRLNPNQSVKKLTDKLMKPYRKAAERAVVEEKKVLTKQVNEEALRPNSIKPVDKKFEDKSISEMEAELGVVY